MDRKRKKGVKKVVTIGSLREMYNSIFQNRNFYKSTDLIRYKARLVSSKDTVTVVKVKGGSRKL